MKCVTIVCAFFSPLLFATNYYVAPWGDDQNNGQSPDSVFATLQYAVDIVVAGDTGFVFNGEYTGFDLRTPGTENLPIVFNILGDSVVINQENNITFDGINIENADWVDIRFDLLHYVLSVLDTAWALGFLPGSQDIADYKLGGMNAGWEVPGLNISTTVFRNINLLEYTWVGRIIEKEKDCKKHILLSLSLFFKNKIILRFTQSSKKPLKIILYDILGRTVFEKDYPSTSRAIILDDRAIREFPVGVYFLRVYSAKRELGKFKLIKI